jgi:hypothetical protein
MILARRGKREEEFNILSSKKGRGGETIGDKQFKAFLKKQHVYTNVLSYVVSPVMKMYFKCTFTCTILLIIQIFYRLNTNKKLSLEKPLKAEL